MSGGKPPTKTFLEKRSPCSFTPLAPTPTSPAAALGDTLCTPTVGPASPSRINPEFAPDGPPPCSSLE